MCTMNYTLEMLWIVCLKTPELSLATSDNAVVGQCKTIFGLSVCYSGGEKEGGAVRQCKRTCADVLSLCSDDSVLLQ